MARKHILALEDDAPDTVDDPIEATPDASDLPVQDPVADVDAPEADASDDVDPDEPVELPETDDLQVDRLDDLSDKAERKAMKRTDAFDYIDNAMSDVTLLNAAVESLYESSRQRMGKAAEQCAYTVLKQVRQRQHLRAQPTVATEAREERLGVALESFINTLKALYRTIVQAIKRALEWVKTYFKKFVKETYWTADTTRRITEAVLNQRRDATWAFEKAHKANLVDEENYVALPDAKRWLSYHGKQPGAGMVVETFDPHTGHPTSVTTPSYAQCFLALIDVAKLHETFASKEFLGFVDSLPQVAEAIANGDPYPAAPGNFDYATSIIVGSRPLDHFEGHTCEEGCHMYVREGFLGGIAVQVEVPYHPATDDARSQIEMVGSWRVSFQKEDNYLTSGSLRFLYDDEIRKGSDASEALSEELGRQQRTLELFEAKATKLQSLLTAMEGRFTDALNQGEAGLDLTHQYTSLAKAVMAIVRNAELVLESSGMYCRKVQYAWLKYLGETLHADKALIQKVTAHMEAAKAV